MTKIAPGGALNTRYTTHIEDSHVSGLIHAFLMKVSRKKQGRAYTWTRLTIYPCSAACASPWRQPSHTAMTHMRWLHDSRWHQSTDHIEVWCFLLVSCRPVPSISARNEDVGRREGETPAPCETTTGPRQRRAEDDKSKDDRQGMGKRRRSHRQSPARASRLGQRRELPTTNTHSNERARNCLEKTHKLQQKAVWEKTETWRCTSRVAQFPRVEVAFTPPK